MATTTATTTASESSVLTLDIRKEILIEAPVAVVWESILEEIGPSMGGGQRMPMVIEPWPGGRWFRDLGDNAGHLWAHVQVIKPPKLLELCGPMFMSYPAANHVQYRLTEADGQTRLSFAHRAVGLLDPEHAKGVQEGWVGILDSIRANAKRRAGSR